MKTKTFEIRDSGTFIPALAVKLNPSNEADRFLLSRAGFGKTPEQQGMYVLLMELDGGKGKFTYDQYDWGHGNRTMSHAHGYILDHFDELESGEVIDVQFLLHETDAPKVTEAEQAMHR